MPRRTLRRKSPRLLFYDLPNEIVLELANHLRPQELNSLIRTCRRYAELLKSQLPLLAASHIRQDGRSALMWALDHGDKAWALDLLERGASVTVQDKKGETALHSALRLPAPDHELVKQLLAKGVYTVPIQRPTQQPVQIAAIQGDFKMAQLLIDDARLAVGSWGWQETIEILVDQQNAAMIQILFAALLVSPSTLGGGLAHAAGCGHGDMVRFFMETYGMNPWLTGWYHYALCRAATGGHAEIVWRLIVAMDPLSLPIPEAALNESALRGHERVVELLLRYRGPATSSQSNTGYGTALHGAALFGHERIVQLLLKAGADVSLQTRISMYDVPWLPSQAWEALQTCEHIAVRQDSTPLHMAAAMGHVQVSRLLVEAGADVTLRNILGDTPLHAAAEGGRLAIMRLLIDAGGDLSVKNDMGDTALHVATNGGNTDMFQLLAASGADLTCTNDVGDSLLHTAAEGGYEDIVKLLIQLGADPSARNDKGETAFQMAESMGHDRIAQLLEGCSEDPPVRGLDDHHAQNWQILGDILKYPSTVSFG